MNIGDKVKFDTYIRINPFTHQYYKRAITHIDKSEYSINRRVSIQDNIITKKIETITHTTPIIGIYVGCRNKKLEWKYRLTTETEDDVIRTAEAAERRRSRLSMIRPPVPTNRRSIHNPRRVDDPYKLDKVALVNMGVGRIIEVPMSNIIKYNCLSNYKLL